MKHIINAIRNQGGKMLVLLGPVIVSQYAYLASGVVDTVMSGKLGTTALAGVAVGSAVWVPLQMFTSGVMYGFLILLSHLSGGDNKGAYASLTQQAMWLGMFLGLIMSFLIYLIAPHLAVFGVDAEVAANAEEFLVYVAWALPFTGIAIAVRFYCEGQKIMLPATVVTILAIGVNALGNYGLMFGNLGMPNLGIAGCGLATGLSMVFGATCYLLYASFAPRFTGVRLLATFYKPDMTEISRIFKAGLAIGLVVVSEFLVFSVIALFISSQGPIAAASHQIAFNFMMVMFTLPACISIVTSIMVGNAHGADNTAAKKDIVTTSLTLSCTLGVVLTIMMYIFAPQITKMYTDDLEVISVGSSILTIAAFFQLVDALQVSMNGALRGIGDTNYPFCIISIVYWLLCIPLGYGISSNSVHIPMLGNVAHLNIAGWWVALVASIGLISILFAFRIRQRFYSPVRLKNSL